MQTQNVDGKSVRDIIMRTQNVGSNSLSIGHQTAMLLVTHSETIKSALSKGHQSVVSRIS